MYKAEIPLPFWEVLGDVQMRLTHIAILALDVYILTLLAWNSEFCAVMDILHPKSMGLVLQKGACLHLPCLTLTPEIETEERMH